MKTRVCLKYFLHACRISHCSTFYAIVRFLVICHLHILCLAFVSTMFNVIIQCTKPMLAYKFHIIIYFYLIKSCNFSDLLLLINNSVVISLVMMSLAATLENVLFTL